jgi:hypothetical protein
MVVVKQSRGSFSQRIKEIDMFFQGTDPVHQTMNRVLAKLEEAKIPYAIVGGMAVNAHRHQRTTKDVDFLVTAEGLRAFRDRYLHKEFTPVAGRPRRFVDSANNVCFDLLVTGLFPGSGKPGPIAFPNPGDVIEVIDNRCVVNLPTLVQLKLAARRYQDFADVVNLIRVHNLDEGFLTQLHPAVHGDFAECLEEKRREDEYEAGQDQAFEQLTSKPDSSPPSGLEEST